MIEKIVVEKMQRCRGESREQGLSIDGKEIEFPTRFARLVHWRKKCAKPFLTKKSVKPDCPCLASHREDMRQIRKFMKE